MISSLMRLVARLPLSFPKAVVVASLLLTVAFGVFIPRLHVTTDRNVLSGTDNEQFRRREEVAKLFGTALVEVVIVSAPTRRDARQAADRISEALKAHPEMVKEAFHRADIEFFERHALMFTPKDSLAQVVETVNGDTFELNALADLSDLSQMLELGAEKMEEQTVPENADPEEVKKGFEFFSELLDDVRKWFEDPSVNELGVTERLWKEASSLQGGAQTDGYLTDNDGEKPALAVIFVQPASDSQAMEVVAPLTDMIRREAKQVVSQIDGADALVTGMPALQTDELRLVTRDCMVSGVVAGVGVLLVFILAFRSFKVALFLVLPLGVGLVWAAGFTGLVYGHLTMITSYFAAVLFGLGVAFTIHIVSRYHEALRAGDDKRKAVETALTKAGPGVVVGGVTTAVAFGAIAFSEFQGFSEMGIISGVGVAMILVANLTLLPAALLLWHPGAKAVVIKKPKGAVWVSFARSKVVVPVIAALGTLAGAGAANFVGFDYAVENMLPGDAEAVRGIRLMDRRTDFSSTYSVSVADSLDEAKNLKERFESLSTVSRAEAISMFVPSGQKEKLALIAGISNQRAAQIHAASKAMTERMNKDGEQTAAALSEAFVALSDMVQDLSFDAKKAGRAEAPMLDDLSKKAADTAKAIAKSGDDNRARELERHVFTLMERGLGVLASGLKDRGFGVDDLPETIRGRYVSKEGRKFAVIVYPDGDIGEKEFFFEHVDQVLSVDPEATGHPVTHKAFTLMVHRGFTQAVLLSAGAVVLLLLLDLRSIRGMALALAPVVVASAWSMLVMYLTGFQFNYANLMAITILIGTGVDYGAHLAHRAAQEGSVTEAARTTGKAIALSGVTTLIGFGSLILGNHWGVRSLGLLLAMGIFFSLVAALVVLPGMLRDRKARDHAKEGGPQ